MAYGARLESVLGASPRGFESPILRHRTPGPLQVPGFLLLVACGAAGVPGVGGPGRCVCRWAAARPRVVRAASFARRVVSKPGQAPPPPTGTAAGPSGALHTGGTCVAWTSPARPRRRPPAPRQVPPNQWRPSHWWRLWCCVHRPAIGRLLPGCAPASSLLDSEALDDLCARERGQDLARHKELRSAQARADAAPSDRACRVDKEPP